MGGAKLPQTLYLISNYTGNLFSSLLKTKSSGVKPEKDLLAYTFEQIQPLIEKKRLGLFPASIASLFQARQRKRERSGCGGGSNPEIISSP